MDDIYFAADDYTSVVVQTEEEAEQILSHHPCGYCDLERDKYGNIVYRVQYPLNG